MKSSMIGRVAVAAVAAGVLAPAAVTVSQPNVQPVALVSLLPADGPGGLGGGGDGPGGSVPNPVAHHGVDASSDSSGSAAPAPESPSPHAGAHLGSSAGQSDADPAAGPVKRPTHGVAAAGGQAAAAAPAAAGEQASGIMGLVDKILGLFGLHPSATDNAQSSAAGPAPKPQAEQAATADQSVADGPKKLGAKAALAAGKQSHAPVPTPDTVVHSVESGVSKLINSLGR